MSKGTSAHVGIMLYGSEGKSGARHLSKRGAFQRNSHEKFVIATNTNIGHLTKVKLWHDNTGLAPSWYVHKVIVKDMLTHRLSYFLFNCWFSLDMPDGRIEQEATVTGTALLALTLIIIVAGTALLALTLLL